MSETKSQTTINAALRLGFLNEEQVEAIRKESANSNYPLREVAIRRGLLNRQHLDILHVFSKPTDVVPGYRIDGMIGQGGVGVVYKATQIRMNRPVAIKTINRASSSNELASKRFEREAQIVGQLRHPNIVSAFDFGLHKEQLFLIMEFVEGIDAEKRLLKTEEIPELHAWEIALQVCLALDYANQSGIIHRDIKPANLILTKAPLGSHVPAEIPFVKIADFGLARFKDKSTNASITRDAEISGTPFYMSTEQISALEIDHRSDIYSLGVTLWHLIVGCPPITGGSPLEVIANKMKLEDSWLSDPPDEITPAGFEILKKMCRHNRDDRISDYAELIKEIEFVISSLRSNDPSETGNFEPGTSDYSATVQVTFVDELSDFNQDSLEQTSNQTQDFNSPQPTAIDLTSQDQPGGPERNENGLQPSRISIWTWITAMVGAAALLGLFLFFRGDPSPDSNRNGVGLTNNIVGVEPSEPRDRLIFNGRPIPLFRGTRLVPTQKFTGTWEPANDLQGGNVMAGSNGWRNFKCVDTDREPLDLFGFSCGFQHHESDEIQYRWLDSSQKTVFAATITPEQSSLSLADGAIVQSLNFERPELKGYRKFQIESQSDHWRVMIDSELLGEIQKPANEKGLPTIQLVVTGAGQAYFEGIEFRLAREQ